MKLSQIVEAFTDLLDGGNSDPVNIRRETGLPEERCQEISDLFHRCMSEKCHGQKQSAQAHELFTGCLVICRSDGGLYRVATRQLMTAAQAEAYYKGISPDREPIIVSANIDWDLRPIEVE